MVTTTESISGPAPFSCQRCGRVVRGVLVGTPSGTLVGECCARPSDRDLIREMEVPIEEAPVQPGPVLVAFDPFDAVDRVPLEAARIIAAIRAKAGHPKSEAQRIRYRQATSDVVSEVLDEGLPNLPGVDDLRGPSIPQPGELWEDRDLGFHPIRATDGPLARRRNT